MKNIYTRIDLQIGGEKTWKEYGKIEFILKTYKSEKEI
jgi:hypothetical protein